MLFPKLKKVKQKTFIQNEFRGLDTNLFPDKFGFIDMKNLSADDFPIFSPRKSRKVLTTLEKPNGIFSKDGLIYVDGEKLYHNGQYICDVLDNKKTFASFNDKLIVFPDKISVNLSTGEKENLEARFETVGAVSVCFSDTTGKAYENVLISSVKPENVKDGDFWLDTSKTPHILKVYSEYLEEFSDIETTYLKISSNGIGTLFSKYEGVKISGLIKDELNTDYVISETGDNFIVIPAVCDEVFSQNETVTVYRKIPDMDFICAFSGRLWGCNKEENEIYASRLLDEKSFYSFSGLSTDSYALKLSSDGEFTGCCAMDNSVIFFKENEICKIYGTKPSNFTLSEYLYEGAEKGSEKSICLFGGNIYYKAKSGFYVFDGVSSYKISKALDNLKLSNAVCGVGNNKYYVNCESDNKRINFVYSEDTSLWHKEDEISFLSFASMGESLYGLKNDGKIISFDSDEKEDFDFYAITTDLNYFSPDYMHLTKIALKADIKEDSVLKVAVSYDGGEFTDILNIDHSKPQSFSIALNLRRSKKVNLKIYGKGEVKIYSLIRYFESGGEI